MESELSKHSDTRDKFSNLHEKLKKALDAEYSKNKEKAASVLGAIREEEGMAIGDLLQNLLLPGEELIPDLEPLSVTSYSIRSAYDPYDLEKRLDSGHDVEMYLTNRRLLVIHAGQTIYPLLGQDSPKQAEWKVGHANGDTYTFMPFPLTNIYGVSLDIHNQVLTQSTVELKGRIWPAVVGGILLAIVGGVLLAFSLEDYGIWGGLALVIGVLVAAAGLLHSRAKVSDPQSTQTKRGKWLRLVILDPIYMTKASFHAQIDEAQNSAKLMARWVRELQNRSEAICDSKVSEKRMIT